MTHNLYSNHFKTDQLVFDPLHKLMTLSLNNNEHKEHKEGNLYLQVMTTIALESHEPTATKTKALNQVPSPLLKPKA